MDDGQAAMLLAGLPEMAGVLHPDPTDLRGVLAEMPDGRGRDTRTPRGQRSGAPNCVRRSGSAAASSSSTTAAGSSSICRCPHPGIVTQRV